jgi:hypothetical protein
MKKLGLTLLTLLLWVFGITFADTIWWSFTAIPIYKDTSSTVDISQKLDLKAGWLVDQTNWIYYVVWKIPGEWSGENVAWIDVKGSCDASAINISCVEINKRAVFVLQWNDNWVVIKKIIELFGNWTYWGDNRWGIHKNAKWDIFLIENIWSDIRIWTLVGSDLLNPTLTADSPVTIDANIDAHQWISIINDYLFYHWSKGIRRRNWGCS